MSNRTMYDSSSPGSIPPHGGSDLVAGYITGSPGANWVGHSMDVTIDQAGGSIPGLDRNTAIVKDLEPAAYRPSDIPSFQFKNVARPTIYCDRSDLLNGVIQAWHGDIWLAWPGWNGESFTSLGLTDAQAKQIIAVQNNFQASFDSSVVLDPSWPKLSSAFPHAPAPPGAWSNAATMTGIGLDGNLYETTYDPSTGTWSGTTQLH